MDREELIDFLGRGSSSVVALYKLHSYNHLVAVKFSNNSSFIVHERTILHHLAGCPQIIQPFHDQLHNSPNHLYLEYAPHGSLRGLLSSSGPLPLAQVRAYTASILKGLDHIHKNRYVHCDIKPDNILVWTETDIKIADFVLAKQAGKDFLSKCFAREPERRWSAEMLLNHRFLEGYGGGNARQSRDDLNSDAELQAAMESYYEYTVELLGIF